MVTISPCMNAQGMLEPSSGHLFPLGQYTSWPTPCLLMLSFEQGKQNLCSGMDGHCTKCVSSRRSVHNVHLRFSAADDDVDEEACKKTCKVRPRDVLLKCRSL